MIQISEEILEALLLYQEKIKELTNSRFFHFYFEEQKGINFDISWKKLSKGGVVTRSYSEPLEESINAYILPLRFFIQEKEICSVRYLGKKIIPQLENDFPSQADEFNKIRDTINAYLEAPPNIRLKFQWGSEKLEFQTKNDIKNCFIYGHYAHAERKNNRTRWYDLIHRNKDEGRDLFRLNAISIILALTKFFLAISNLILFILEKIIDYNLEEGKNSVKQKDINKGIKFYKNVLYISEKLGKTEISSEMLKKVSELYNILGDTKLFEGYLGRYKESLFSVTHLPEDFRANKFYKEYFSISNEYRDIIEEIIQKSYDFSAFPIIVLPIERIFDAKKFEKIINQRNFQVTQKNDRIRLLYNHHIDENQYIPQKFEFSLNEGYIYEFPFIDDSGILYITNSKELFAERFSIWVELKNLLQNFSMIYIKLMKLIHFLINIEMGENPEISDVESLINFDLEKDEFHLNNSSAINCHAQGTRNILITILKISAYPRIKDYIRNSELMEDLRIKGLEPHINKECKGQELFSICLNIILYTFCSGDERYFIYPYLKDFTRLIKICNLIKGKSLNKEFFVEFIHFCYDYIRSLK